MRDRVENQGNAVWLREQIEGLADHIVLVASCTMKEMRAWLLAISSGEPWFARLSARSLSRDAAWVSFVDSIRRASVARLELLRELDISERLPCPWARLVPCDAECRCGGAGMVMVSFLRDHYAHLPVEVARIASPTSVRRAS